MAFGIAISFMSNIGAIIAIGTSIYIGVKILKALIAKEIKEENKENNIK